MTHGRLIAISLGLGLLVFGWMRVQAGGQAAIPWSLEGQEDLSFWVDHNGLDELDVEGPVGFGDMGRLLMRRRSNRGRMQALRDRFVFRVRDFETFRSPDLLHLAIENSGLTWEQRPERVVVTAGKIFNLPLIAANRTGENADLSATLGESSFTGQVAGGESAGFFFQVVEKKPGLVERKIRISLGDAETTVPLTFDVRPTSRLEVRLLGADGSPTQARVYVTAADGLGYAPDGSINRFAALPAEQYFHADGRFALELPAGRTVIEATRGQEYRIARREVHLEPGQTRTIDLTLERWVYMAAEGWYSADSHIHANYTAPHHQVITPADVRLQTLAEDLNYANLMVANSGSDFIHDEEFFEGRPHDLSRPGYVMYWGEEMRNAGTYGHMSFFGLKELVHPIYTGFRNTPHHEDYPPNYAQAKAARAQGGAVTYVHPGYGATLPAASARELPVDLALGEVDAIDVISNNPEEVAQVIWYRLLNCGFQLSASAGTDAFTNVADHYTPGGGRVYALVEGAFDHAKWLDAYKQGRSFASNGPVIDFTVDGQGPGSRLALDEGREVMAKARVRTLVPLERVEVVVNGEAVVSRSIDRGEVVIEESLDIDKSSWLAVRALGPRHRLILNDTAAFAHTSPVYIDVAGRPLRKADDLRFFADWITKLIDRVEQRGRFDTEARKREVIGLFERARARYE